jgi:hypothetical protein
MIAKFLFHRVVHSCVRPAGRPKDTDFRSLAIAEELPRQTVIRLQWLQQTLHSQTGPREASETVILETDPQAQEAGGAASARATSGASEAGSMALSTADHPAAAER